MAGSSRRPDASRDQGLVAWLKYLLKAGEQDGAAKGCASQDKSSKAAVKPNILFILTDQWRAQAFGYAGDEDRSLLFIVGLPLSRGGGSAEGLGIQRQPKQ